MTITDPSRPELRPADELDAEQPRSRRGLYAAVVALLLLAGLRVGDAVRDRRATAQEEQRLASAVELEVTDRFAGGSSSSLPGDRATVVVDVGLRNAGPRDLVVLSAAYGPLSQSGERALAAGRELPFALTTDLDCSEPPPLLRPRPLVLLVRTSGGDEVPRELPAPQLSVDDRALLRACRYLETYEAASAFPVDSFLADDALVLDLEVSNAGRAPLQLTAVGVGTGLSAELLADDGSPLPLPLDLPAGAGPEPRPVSVRALVRVEDCSAVRRTSDPDLMEGGDAAIFTTDFGDGSPFLTRLPDLSVLQALLDRECG